MPHKLFHDFVTLFVVINPIANVPLFIAVAGHESRERQRQIAIQGMVVAAAILVAFIAIGQPILDALGIDLGSFQIAGGLILLIIALRMVLDEVRDPSRHAAHPSGNVAIFPVAMPFIAGPGTIMAVVLLSDNNRYTVWQQVNTALVLLVVLFMTYGCLVGAQAIQRLLGTTGTNVVSRIMGLVLLALAVQSMIAGLRLIKVF